MYTPARSFLAVGTLAIHSRAGFVTLVRSVNAIFNLITDKLLVHAASIVTLERMIRTSVIPADVYVLVAAVRTVSGAFDR